MPVERPKDLSPAVIQKYLAKIKWRRAARLEQRGNFDEKYPEDYITAFLLSGQGYFDRDILIARKRELFGFKPWKTFSNGQAQIFRQRIPGLTVPVPGLVTTDLGLSDGTPAHWSFTVSPSVPV